MPSETSKPAPNPRHPYDAIAEEHERMRKALVAIRKAMQPHSDAKRLLGTDARMHNTMFAAIGEPCPWCLMDTIIADGLKRCRA